jgi:putative alpha-1,2-mannosidase
LVGSGTDRIESESREYVPSRGLSVVFVTTISVGTPLFKEAKLNLENGKCLTIEAKNNSATNKYIRSIKLNGKNHTLNYFKHNVLVEGGKIQFLMDNEPNLKRGSTKETVPYSFSLANE